MAVFRNVAPCGLVETDRNISGSYCIHHHCNESWNSEHLWNVGRFLWHYIAQHHRRQSVSNCSKQERLHLGQSCKKRRDNIMLWARPRTTNSLIRTENCASLKWRFVIYVLRGFTNSLGYIVVGLEANAEKSKCMFMSCHQTPGQNDKMKAFSTSFGNVRKSKPAYACIFQVRGNKFLLFYYFSSFFV
jgi:hypothetical protein